MKNPNTMFTTILLLLGCCALSPVAQAKPPPSEDRGNGNSAAENVDALSLGTTGSNNTAHGWFSLFSNTTGSSNAADGFQALYSNTAGGFNTATGFQALKSNGTGNYNTANGAGALLSNDTGTRNSAFGSGALAANTSGAGNTALGNGALFSNTADSNTAVGSGTLASNTTGNGNSAIGAGALEINTEGSNNTANGFSALAHNIAGPGNTAIGHRALFNNTNGAGNTALGLDALSLNSLGSVNTAIGFQALVNNNGDGNTALGEGALFNNATGSVNTALGRGAGFSVISADNVICIGIAGRDVSNSCYIGNIWNQPGGSQAVYVNSEGKLGALVSSRRFKDEIKPMEQASEIIYSLKPVSFRYKKEIEPTRPLGFGLIAEDVEKISPDLVTRGGDRKVNSVRYDAVNAMLLNEFLKGHRTVQELKKEIAALTATVKEQAAQIQKVSTQIEMGKFATGRIRRGGHAPQVVLNNP